MLIDTSFLEINTIINMTKINQDVSFYYKIFNK